MSESEPVRFLRGKGGSAVPCGRKRKRKKMATHKRKKRLRRDRHKKKNR